MVSANDAKKHSVMAPGSGTLPGAFPLAGAGAVRPKLARQMA
jgi:hypothetical protein